jgi:hypothetical protein
MALVPPSVHQCKASFFDRDLCFGCDPVGAMHSYCCELEEGHEGPHIGRDPHYLECGAAQWTNTEKETLNRCV